MRLLVAGLLLFFLWPKTVQIKYCVEGIDNNTVVQSINQWNFTNVEWKKVSSSKEANLTIVRSKCLSVPNRYGEANHREIRVNNNYKLTNKELTNLISHEIGHYMFLQHNNKNSIMNNKIKLSDKLLTQEDKNSLSFITLRVIAAKFLGFVVDLSSN